MRGAGREMMIATHANSAGKTAAPSASRMMDPIVVAVAAAVRSG